MPTPSAAGPSRKRSGTSEYAYGYRPAARPGRVGFMTTPLSVPPRSTGRGLTPVLAASVVLALAWTCAILYVVARWTLG